MAKEQTIEVLMGAYFSTEAAHDDLEAVKSSGASVLGAVLVSKDLKGVVTVEQEDQAVRKGATAFGGAGLVIGLFAAPPLLAATAAGAVIGAGVGKLASRKIRSGIEEQAGPTIPIGGAGLVVAYPQGSGPAVDAAVQRAIKRVVGEATGSRSQALKAAMADAQAKMNAPDPS